MPSRPNHPLSTILHPYVFVLKEGKMIKKDFLDYSLVMLYIHSTETIRSPVKEKPVLLQPEVKKAGSLRSGKRKVKNI